MTRRFDNPVLGRVISQQWKVGKICFALIVQSLLLVAICQLLFVTKLGRHTDLIFLSEALLALIVPPYLACNSLNRYFAPLLPTDFLQLSRVRPRWSWLSVIWGSQVYTLCFVSLATVVFLIFVPSISIITYFEVVKLQLVIAIYVIVAASVGGFWWCVFRHEIYATEATYAGWIVLLGGVFLLVPLDRYMKNLEPIIPPFLHLNPLSAVYHLLKLDVFRTPHLYELTPIPSYMVVYPSWYVVCGWQILIGIFCITLASWKRS